MVSANNLQGIRQQWQNPNDIFSLLLLLGGDVIQSSLAQLAGEDFYFTIPVAFSFGWAAYSISSLLSIISGGSLMPEADHSCQIVNCNDGNTRQVRSFILARLFRDIEYWAPKEVARSIHQRPFRIHIFKSHKIYPRRDRLTYLSTLATILQLIVMTCAVVYKQSYETLLVTFFGMALAYITAHLPQWKKEKWQVRELDKAKDIAFLQNPAQGSSYALVIRCQKGMLDLQALATADNQPTIATRFAIGLISMAWLALLITATAIKENTWFIMGIGIIGMIQNIVVAGFSRQPVAWGFNMDYTTSIPALDQEEAKVMESLRQIEGYHPAWGCGLVPLLFDDLSLIRHNEDKFWNLKKEQLRAATKREDQYFNQGTNMRNAVSI